MDHDLLCKVIEHYLPGQAVAVRFVRPAGGYGGRAYRNFDNRLGLDLDPDLPDSQALPLLLHETAHLRLHSKHYRPLDPDRPIPPAPVSQEGQAAYKKLPHELEADELAGRWLDFAERNYRYQDKSRPVVDRMLLALLDPDYDRAINLAAIKAARKAIGAITGR